METNLDRLPSIIVVYILCFLNKKDVASFGRTNKKFNKISKNNMIWKVLYNKHFYVSPDQSLDSEINFTKSLDKIILKGSQNLLELGKKYLEEKDDGKYYDQFLKKLKLEELYVNSKPVFCPLNVDSSVVVVRVTKNYLIFGYATGIVAAYNLEESQMGLKEVWKNTANEAFIWWMEVSENIVGIACNDGKMNLLNIDDGELICSLTCFKRPCWVIKINKKEDRLLGGSDGGEIAVFKLSTQTEIARIKFKSSIYDLCILDSKNFLMGSNNGVLKLYTTMDFIKEGEWIDKEKIIEKELIAHEEDDTLWVLSVNEYNQIFTSSSDMAICFWDLKTKTLIRKFDMPKTVQSVCIYENKIFAGLGGFQPLLCVWNFQRVNVKIVRSSKDELQLGEQPGSEQETFVPDILFEKLSEVMFKESASRIYSLVVRGNKVVFASDRKVFYVDFEHQKVDKNKKCVLC